MTRTLRYSCPSCNRKLPPIDGMDHATQVVRRTCKCGETWQLVVRRLPSKREDMVMDSAELTFIGRRPRKEGTE